MNDVYFTVVFKAESLEEEERKALVEKCSAASWSHAIDERKAMEAEVERLRSIMSAQNTVLRAVTAGLSQLDEGYVALKQERDQLKVALQRFMELDKHDRDLADELWAAQHDTPAQCLAAHDADVIEQAVPDFLDLTTNNGDWRTDVEFREGWNACRDSVFHHAAKLRQQTKEADQ